MRHAGVVSQRREKTRDTYFFYFSIALVLLIGAVNIVADLASR
jgi:hypothetical protein